MPNIVKIFISFLIMIIISVLLIFTVFFSKIDLKFLKFINSNLEIKYNGELKSISETVENNFIERNRNIDNFIKLLDMDKFKDIGKSRGFSINDEMKKFQTLRNTEKDFLEKIKIVSFSKDLVFSTDDRELKPRGNLVEFDSVDDIENTVNLFDNSKTTGFIFDNKGGYIIFKKPVAIGVALFYYKNSLLNELLKNSDVFEFKNIYYVNDKTIFINKPDNLPVEKLSGISVNQDDIKTIETSISNDKNNIQRHEFRFFSSKLKLFDVWICELVDNKYFELDRTKKIILVFLLMFTLYLLILILLLFRKTDLEKAKESLSLFTAVLIEEMINANTKDEFEKIQESLVKRKKTIFENIYSDLKKLKENNKKDLEDQFDRVLKKVEDTFQKKFEGSGTDMEKLEKLFEKLISTISEKGIPINFQNQIKTLESKMIPDNEVENAEEAESVEEIQEADSAEEVQELEEVPEAAEVTETTSETPEEISEEITEEIAKEIPEESSGKTEEKSDELIGEAEEIREISDQEESSTEKTTESVPENKDITDIPANNEPENIKNAAGNVPEIIEIGDEDEGDLEDIFENNEKVELLKVKNSDFLNMEKEKASQVDNTVDTENTEEIEDIEETEDAESVEELESVEEASSVNPENASELEELPESGNEIPKIPEEFYVDNVIEDDLTKEIKKIEKQKTALQILLDDIYEKTGTRYMSLLIKLQTKNSFMQTFQKGFKNTFIDRIEIDGNNILIQHIFTNERLVFISDLKKTSHLFQNLEFEKEYENAKSLLIYPVKIFGKIRALLILAFETDEKENLDKIIKILEKNKENLRKSVMKLI
jgi:hypothetical protein